MGIGMWSCYLCIIVTPEVVATIKGDSFQRSPT